MGWGATGGSGADGAVALPPVSAGSTTRCPHASQNRAAGRSFVPQRAQVYASSVPHASQKRAAARFSCPHAVQRMAAFPSLRHAAPARYRPYPTASSRNATGRGQGHGVATAAEKCRWGGDIDQRVVIMGGMATREGYRWFRGRWRPSAAQRRVLDELAAGRPNAEIALRLGLSLDTVKWHMAQLRAETGSA